MKKSELVRRTIYLTPLNAKRFDLIENKVEWINKRFRASRSKVKSVRLSDLLPPKTDSIDS